MIEQRAWNPTDSDELQRAKAERDALRSELEIQALNYHTCMEQLWAALDRYQPLVGALLELLEAVRVNSISPNGPTQLRLEQSIRDVQSILFARWGHNHHA